METRTKSKSIKIDDIYFVLLRRKWMILTFIVAGVVSAAVVWKTSTRLYSSKALLLVRYIVESTAVMPPGSDEQVRQVDSRGESILDTEVKILTSEDLVEQVVEAVGPERILGRTDQPATVVGATHKVTSGLQVTVPRRSAVIHVAFYHPDAEVTRDVLDQLTALYVTKHQVIHQSGNTYDEIARKTDEMRLRLRETEEALQKLREETDGVSLPDAKKAVAGEMESLRQSILATETELAASMATLPQVGEGASISNSIGAAQGAAASTKSTNVAESVSAELAYGALIERLQALRAREQVYLTSYREENVLVKSVRAQISELQAKVDEMLAANPILALTSKPLTSQGKTSTGGDGAQTTAALLARLNVLTNQLERVRQESMMLSDLEKRISEIQLSRDIQEENLRYAAISLEQARYGSALELGKNSNISVIQEPSHPVLDMEPVKKRALALLGSIAGAGFLLAFLIEFVIDPRIKGASQLEAKSDVRVLMTIPKAAPKVVAATTSGRLLKSAGNGDPGDEQRPVPAEPGLNGNYTQFRAYFEALRDRVILYFERINLRRKPKLIGVTGCHDGAGASTVAEGLAAALSETGGGKVMLVDMNVGQESVRPFEHGNPAPQLRALLEASENANGTDRDKLILTRVEQQSEGVHPARSREFDMLIPKLKASDFDYIVFDLPPVHPTSATFRLAGFLDKILLVAEVEKTHVDTVGRAEALLKESNARVTTVLNKGRNYVPRWLRSPG